MRSFCRCFSSRSMSFFPFQEIEAEWLEVPDGEEIKRKHRLERQRGFTGETGWNPSDDICDWARRLLEEESPEMLVARLLEEIDRNTPGVYLLRDDLEKDLARENGRKQKFSPGTPSRRPRAARSSSKTVKLGLAASRDWNVGKVLSGICNALDISGKDMARHTG